MTPTTLQKERRLYKNGSQHQLAGNWERDQSKWTLIVPVLYMPVYVNLPAFTCLYEALVGQNNDVRHPDPHVRQNGALSPLRTGRQVWEIGCEPLSPIVKMWIEASMPDTASLGPSEFSVLRICWACCVTDLWCSALKHYIGSWFWTRDYITCLLPGCSSNGLNKGLKKVT